jgi:hypothetical protein
MLVGQLCGLNFKDAAGDDAAHAHKQVSKSVGQTIDVHLPHVIKCMLLCSFVMLAAVFEL